MRVNRKLALMISVFQKTDKPTLKANGSKANMSLGMLNEPQSDFWDLYRNLEILTSPDLILYTAEITKKPNFFFSGIPRFCAMNNAPFRDLYFQVGLV
ncbi:hypothetical protein L596_015349 [Steinernema carpocapsae]|uniref:Uncharacterized protein n=1 Tax=Steinernema carpocapsae TaxID=34508 RepID=A0A4U5NFL4_STECR|nr:hypothetical protein L596_015349 [Steinernema carpocapsae]